MSVSAVTGITDVFGDDYVDYDVNIDGFFNIKDLVRAKNTMLVFLCQSI